MFFSCRDWETSPCQYWGKDERSKVKRSLMKTCSTAIRTSDRGEVSPSNRTTTLSTHPRQRRSGFGTSLWMSEWASLSPDLNPTEHPWRNLKIAVQQRSPSNLTALERICREWENLPKYRCDNLVASYPRRLKSVIAAKGVSTKYRVKGLNTYVNVLLNKIYKLANIYKNVFLLCHNGAL